MRPRMEAEVSALRIVYREARRVADARTAASCLERLSWLAWVLLDGDLSDECMREAESLEVPKGTTEAFRLAVRRAANELQRGDVHRALAMLDAAERDGERLDIDAFVAYLSVRADVLSALGESDAAIECARLAVSIAEKRRNPEATVLACFYLAYAYEASGSYDESQTIFDRAAALASDAGLGWLCALANVRGAWVSFLRGDGKGAQARFTESLRTTERTPWLSVTQAYVGIVLGLSLGDDALAATFADESWIDRALASRDAYSIGRTLGAFYDLHRLNGDVERGNELARLALEHCNSAACVWPVFAPVAKYGSLADIDRARALLDAFPEAHPVASAHRRLFEAVLAERSGDPSTTARRAGEAYLLFEPLGCKYYATIALVLAARFTEARARLAAYGYAGTERRVALRAARGRPRLSYEGAQQRREILSLILQGKSSREIGLRLGLSERTIKSRVSEIFAITGTKKRSDLTLSMTSLL